MSDFKVIEIIDAVTIRVSPGWIFRGDGEGNVWEGDRVVISNLAIPKDDVYAKLRLSTLLNGKEVDLYTPVIVDPDNRKDSVVACYVYIDKTDVTYYFPEYANSSANDFFASKA